MAIHLDKSNWLSSIGHEQENDVNSMILVEAEKAGHLTSSNSEIARYKTMEDEHTDLVCKRIYEVGCLQLGSSLNSQ